MAESIGRHDVHFRHTQVILEQWTPWEWSQNVPRTLFLALLPPRPKRACKLYIITRMG